MFHAWYVTFPVNITSMRERVVSGESPQLKSGKDLIFKALMGVSKHVIDTVCAETNGSFF